LIISSLQIRALLAEQELEVQYGPVVVVVEQVLQGQMWMALAGLVVLGAQENHFQ
jgi:hypothetical protein